MLPQLDLGVSVDDLRLPVKEGLRTASAMGFRSSHLAATHGPIQPGELTETGQRELLRYTERLGMMIRALGGDLGSARFADSSALEQRVFQTGRILELAARLRVPVVTAAIGSLSMGGDDARNMILSAVRVIAEYADKTGRIFAIETAMDSAEDLDKLVKTVACDNVRVCVDPGSLLMNGHDPVQAVTLLADRISTAYVRDGVAGTPGRPGRETEIGKGQVDFQAYLQRLDEAGYTGPHFLRGLDSPHAAREIARAKQRLDSMMQR